MKNGGKVKSGSGRGRVLSSCLLQQHIAGAAVQVGCGVGWNSWLASSEKQWFWRLHCRQLEQPAATASRVLRFTKEAERAASSRQGTAHMPILSYLQVWVDGKGREHDD